MLGCCWHDLGVLSEMGDLERSLSRKMEEEDCGRMLDCGRFLTVVGLSVEDLSVFFDWDCCCWSCLRCCNDSDSNGVCGCGERGVEKRLYFDLAVVKALVSLFVAAGGFEGSSERIILLQLFLDKESRFSEEVSENRWLYWFCGVVEGANLLVDVCLL